MKNIRSTLATVWRIASPYFNSEDKWAGRGLLAAVIVIELASVFLTVLFNRWNNVFYNALQERDQAVFSYQIGYFCVLAAFWIGLKVYQLYLNQWLQIRWRRWMTTRYLGGWLHDANHYRMQLLGDAADNPDQRIADDTQRFVEQTLTLGIGLLSSVVTLASFVVILWGLSNQAPLHLFGNDIAFPGYLVWGALVYAILGTTLTHLIGRPLVDLNFRQQRFEADFRFNLVRTRENAEQIALLEGEPAERTRLLNRFGFVVGNWLDIMQRTKKLTAFTATYSQAAVIFPYVLIAPAYFANKIQLGGMMQTASAFSSVQDSLSFFITAYRTLAEWQSVVARLDGFEGSIRGGDAFAQRQDIIRVKPAGRDGIELDDLVVTLPDGKPLLAADGFKLPNHQRTLVTGPSGAGKSTLFRAIAGIWPFGKGAINVPANASLMMLPQHPYLPIGSLHDAVVYPGAAAQFDAGRVREILTAVGLPQLAARLAEEAHWNRMLSLGEQQRLGIARALLHQPQFLFLDEATASLDEPSEAALYRLLADSLPDTAVVSIGHRSTLDAFHQRNVALVRDGDRFTLHDRVEAPAS
ncbi:ABC transporter ATP-binding protein/permease [Bradyrhizobium viridifuturi]|nr:MULTISPECIES: ABC transporter ATP-binding protein/permease [Bradyrhizobium]ERF80360.1 MAG: ABC transporter [Bradyrhizobium sp. DFCI-1]OYU61272.1 MAG: ABC transporter ATP-binding protein [Bradyrhizobium sp. PARBB1]PSO29031.1 ABC transporter ATP-binding protein/permease [Bradyrhizobium sp. MOS004]QRI70793.1 ABC transporter ATP-binding protein/permease [Bradyrhizobium sp. PSBB068]MBR1020671.1 ABC transporter ATP-binding protein/permease [Bradyrhizobium viridifuturi]